MCQIDFVKLESIFTVIGVCVAAIGLYYAGKQLRGAQKSARGEFLLRLDEMFKEHVEVHTRLRPGGVWTEASNGPRSVEDWVAVERYMGLFERIKILVDDGVIDLDTVDRMYGYRVFNIVENKTIYAKLVDESEDWRDFLGLWQALMKNRQRHQAKWRRLFKR